MFLYRAGHGGALALAGVLIVVTMIYSVGWSYHAARRPSALLGIDFDYNQIDAALHVTDVLAGTPADAVHLLPGDRIMAIDGHALTTQAPLYDAITRGVPGNRVRLTVERADSTDALEIDAILARPPAAPPQGALRAIAEGLLQCYPFGFLVVMAFLLLQRPQDRNAWLVALLFAGFIAGAPVDPATASPWMRRFALAYKTMFTALTPAFFYSLFAVFPARSPFDRRRPALKIWLVAAGLVLGAPVAVRVLAAGTWDPLTRMLAEPGWQAAGLAATVYGLAGFVLGTASLVWNYRAAPDAAARRRTRFIVWGTVISVTPIVTLFLLSRGLEPYAVFPFWVWSPAVFALLLLPLWFAYAVIKYRVIEIPLLLKRSARYLLVQRGFILLVALLAIVASVGLAFSFPRVAPTRPDLAIPAGLLVGIGFGLALAWAATRVHRGMARRIDRAFFRSAYDARRILEDLAVQAASTTSRHELGSLLGACVEEALRPAALAVYVETGETMLCAVEGQVPPELGVVSARDPSLQPLIDDPKPFIVDPGEEGERHRLPLLAPLAPECIVPMVGHSGVLRGLLILGSRRSDEPYSSEDRRLLASVCRQAGLALENMTLAERMAERIESERRTAQELAIAQEVQTRLLPQEVPWVPTLDFRGACLQARAVGGDYYDFLDLGGGSLALVLADISGKGISAALLMANLQAHLRARCLVARDDPAALLTALDRFMFETTAAHHYATLFFGRYDDAARRLVYGNCGHNPPLLLRAAGGTEWLAPTAPAVGLLPVWSCSIGEVTLAAGDVLLIYTDGVTEAMDDAGECFGEERLLDVARRSFGLPLDGFVSAIIAEVQRFSGSQEDDLTLVVARAR